MTDAVLAGLLLGAAAALKPPNLLVARRRRRSRTSWRARWREGLALSASAIVPALLVLLLWKVRGLGEIPAFALEQAQLAAGSGRWQSTSELDRYLDLDFDHWREQMDQLREFFWSARRRAVGADRRARRGAARAARRDRRAARRLARRRSSS